MSHKIGEEICIETRIYYYVKTPTITISTHNAFQTSTHDIIPETYTVLHKVFT